MPSRIDRFRLWTAPAGTGFGSPGWTSVANRCSGTAPATAAQPAVLTAEDFRSLPLPAGISVVQPPGDYVLIRMPTNVYARTTTPIGPSSGPGGPYPTLTHVHEYTARGTYEITMTTYYKGEFRVGNGIWQQVDGQARVDSAAKPVTVLAGTARLLPGAN